MVLSKNGESASALLPLMKKWSQAPGIRNSPLAGAGTYQLFGFIISEKSISLIQVDVSYEDVHTSWLCSWNELWTIMCFQGFRSVSV